MMKCYRMLFIESIAYKYKVYRYLCGMLYRYIRFLIYIAKLAPNKGFRKVLEEIMGITDVKPVKTKSSVL